MYCCYTGCIIGQFRGIGWLLTIRLFSPCLGSLGRSNVSVSHNNRYFDVQLLCEHIFIPWNTLQPLVQLNNHILHCVPHELQLNTIEQKRSTVECVHFSLYKTMEDPNIYLANVMSIFTLLVILLL